MKTKKQSFRKVNSFEHACELTKRDPEKVLADIIAWNSNDLISKRAHKQLEVIADAMENKPSLAGITNKIRSLFVPKFPDFKNKNQRKYYPFFDPKKDLNVPDGYCYFENPTQPFSTVCFSSEKSAAYTTKKFKHLFRQALFPESI